MPLRTALATAAVLMMGMLPGCSADPARETVDRAIERYGGDRFEQVEVTFRFREHRFRVLRDEGLFEYERTGVDDEGRFVRELMTNDTTRQWVDGSEIQLSTDERNSVETAVNSVVYFGFLPFRLDDPAVRLRDLGTATIRDRALHKIEVTFEREGGGRDWEDRFIYWFDRDEALLEHVAYRFHVDDGGTRFRSAKNRRTVGGILIQDWDNWTADPEIEDIANYDDWFDDHRLELVSEVALEDVEVHDPGEAPVLDLLDGIQVNVGLQALEFGAGEPIEPTIRLSNRGDRERTLTFRDAQRFDLILRDSDGRQIARWGEEQAFAQVTGEVTIVPGGDGPIWEAEWTAPEEPGSYQLEISVLSAEGEIGTTVPIEVR